MSRTIEAMIPPPNGSHAAKSKRLTAQWQTGLGTISGLAQRKLALSFAPSPLHPRQRTSEKENVNTPFEPNEANNKWRILMVDNDPQFTRSARLFLQHTGHYSVCEVEDPLRALESARRFKPDLVLIDLIMPQAQGTDVAAQFAADWALHEVPIVFVTALITPEEANDGRRIEGHRVMPKPINAFSLLKIIEENLRCCAEA